MKPPATLPADFFRNQEPPATLPADFDFEDTPGAPESSSAESAETGTPLPGTELMGGKLPGTPTVNPDAVIQPLGRPLADQLVGAPKTALELIGKGVLQTVSGLGSAAEATGNYLTRTAREQGKQGYVGQAVSKVGKTVRELSSAGESKHDPDYIKAQAGRSFLDDPSLLLEPDYINALLSPAIGSTLGMLVPGLGTAERANAFLQASKLTGRVAKIAEVSVGAGAGAVVEVLSDAGHAYQTTLENGGTPRQAAELFTETVKRELPVTVATNITGLFNPATKGAWKVIFSALSGGSQEVLQGVAQRSAENKVLGKNTPLLEGAEMEALAGALGDAVIGGAVEGGSSHASATTPDTTPATVEASPEVSTATPPAQTPPVQRPQRQAPPTSAAAADSSILGTEDLTPEEAAYYESLAEASPEEEGFFPAPEPEIEPAPETAPAQEAPAREAPVTPPKRRPLQRMGLTDAKGVVGEGIPLFRVPLDRIQPTEDVTADPAKMRDVESYAQRLEREEPPPLYGRLTESGDVELGDGHRRLEALKRAGRHTALIAIPSAKSAETVSAPKAGKLAADLAGAKPRYQFGDRPFELQFEDDLDRAAYIVAASTPSKRDADYLKFVVEATGLSETAARSLGREVRASIKEQARTSEAGKLFVAPLLRDRLAALGISAPLKEKPTGFDKAAGSSAEGREVEIAIPGEKRKFAARYAIREADDIVASHNPFNFETDARYEYVNDRDYSEAGNASRVIENSGPNFNPDFLLTDSPTAENGPTIVDPQGNALGGNNRAMAVKRVYQLNAAGAKAYAQQLKERAAQFGIDPAEVDRFSRPVLVRELTEAPQNPQAAITDFNKRGTADLAPHERAVTDGRRLSAKTVERIIAKLEDSEGTLADALKGDNGADIINSLVKDGVITEGEKNAYIDERDQLTSEGKARIAKALVGRLFSTSGQLSQTAPEMRNKLERIAPHVLRVEGRQEWDLTATVREAIGLIEEAKSHKQKNLDDIARQTRLGEPPENAVRYSNQVLAVAKALQQNPNAAVKAFRMYAADEALSRPDAQATMWEPPTRDQAFTSAFAPSSLDRAAEAARDRLNAKGAFGTQLSAGLDPGSLRDLAILTARDIVRAGTTFARWSTRVTKAAGRRIKPYLLGIWARARAIVRDERGSLSFGGGLFSDEEAEAVQRESALDRDRLQGERLTAQFRSGMRFKPVKKAKSEAAPLFGVEDSEQQSLFGSERGAVSIDVTDLQAAVRQKLAGEHYSGLGAISDVFVRNLSQLEKADPEAHAAAVKAAGSKGQTAVLIRAAVPKIEKALGKSASWQEFRAALIESRLRGIRERWRKMAGQTRRASDGDLVQAFENGLGGLLENIEGKRGIPQDVAQSAAALLNHKKYDELRNLLVLTFRDAANGVAEVMPDEAFQRITTDPAFPKGLAVYRELLERPVAENHSSNEGVFSTALGPLQTYYPLIPVTNSDTPKPKLLGKATPYRKPRNIANDFATGLAEEYDISIDALKQRLERAVRGNNKAALIQTLARQGWIRVLDEGERAGDVIEIHGLEFPAEVIEVRPGVTSLKGGKKQYLPSQAAVMPQWLVKELKPVLESGRRPDKGWIDTALDALNGFALVGPLDLVFHSTNLLGTMVANTPYLPAPNTAVKIAGNLPFSKLAYSIVKIANTDPTTEEAVRDLQEMAKLGLVPDKFGGETYSKAYARQTGAEYAWPSKEFGLLKLPSTGALLYGPKGLDARGRLLMYRMGKELMPNAKPAELAQFVNQMGNYVTALQGSVERTLKRSGLSPFYTAGSTMMRNGLNAFLGRGPGVGSRLSYRVAQQLTGGGIGMIALWLVAYAAYRDKWPWEDKEAKFLQIPLKPADRKKLELIYGTKRGTAYISLSFFNPIYARGARAIGAQGAFETRQLGGDARQMATAAVTGTANSALHPAAGPLAKAGTVLLTGYEPYILSLQPFMAYPAARDLEQRPREAFNALNSFFGDLAEASGFGEKRKTDQGNRYLRMLADITLPRLFGTVSDQQAKARRLASERRARQRRQRTRRAVR